MPPFARVTYRVWLRRADPKNPDCSFEADSIKSAAAGIDRARARGDHVFLLERITVDELPVPNMSEEEKDIARKFDWL